MSQLNALLNSWDFQSACYFLDDKGAQSRLIADLAALGWNPVELDGLGASAPRFVAFHKKDPDRYWNIHAYGSGLHDALAQIYLMVYHPLFRDTLHFNPRPMYWRVWQMLEPFEDEEGAASRHHAGLAEPGEAWDAVREGATGDNPNWVPRDIKTQHPATSRKTGGPLPKATERVEDAIRTAWSLYTAQCAPQRLGPAALLPRVWAVRVSAHCAETGEELDHISMAEESEGGDEREFGDILVPAGDKSAATARFEARLPLLEALTAAYYPDRGKEPVA